MPLGKHQVPAVFGGIGRPPLDRDGVFDVEGKVVQPCAAAVVLFGGESRQLFSGFLDDLGELHSAELGERLDRRLGTVAWPL